MAENRKNRRKNFGSKLAKMKILLYKVDMGNKLYEVNFFELCSKKLELMKQNHLLKIGFVIFLKGATFSDFVDYRLWNYIPSGIQICFPLFWGKFFQLGSCLIKQWKFSLHLTKILLSNWGTTHNFEYETCFRLKKEILN